MTKTLLILIAFLFLYGKLFSQTGKLQIHIKVLPELEQFFNSETLHIILLSRESHEVRYVDANSQTVLIDSLKTDSVVVHISAYIKKNNLEKEYANFSNLISIKNDSTSMVEIIFPENCEFNKNSLNNHCPKCKSSNHVLPIKYGLRVPIVDRDGNIQKEEKYYPGGCMVSNCDPSWYCEKDDLKF